MADTLGRPRVPPELALAALVTAAGWPITRLFRNGGAGGTVLVSMMLSLGVAWLARRARLPIIVRALVSGAAFVWFACLAYAPDTLWLIFPTPKSFHALGELMRVGRTVMIDEAAPVRGVPGVLFFVAAGTWLCTWLVDASYELGNPLLAIGAAIPLFLAPGSLVPSPTLALEGALFIGAAAWVLFSHERDEFERRGHTAAKPARRLKGWSAGAGARVTIAGAIIAIVAAPHLPGFAAAPWLRTNGPGARVGFNPIVAIKPTLSQAPNRVLFRVRTTRPGYFRLTELDRFDGKTWRAGSGRVSEPFIGRLPLLTTFYEQVEQNYVIDSLIGAWLPALYDPIRTDAPDGVQYERESHALLYDDLHAGLRYAVTSRIPALTAEQLDGAPSVDTDRMAQYLRLPRSTPKAIYKIAGDIAGAQTTQFRRAVALQEHLRKFTYDQRVAAGHTYDTIVDFLTRSKRGYCEQFATSMAVLARALGMPARVVIGFASGDPDRNDRGVQIVRTKHAHAWVEIYFEGYDWVAFEPTPRAGIVSAPAYTQPDPDTGVPIILPTPSTSPTSSTAPRPVDRPSEGPAQPGGRIAGAIPGWLFPFVVLAVVMAGGYVALLLRRRARKRRALHAPTAREAVVLRYRDFLGWCASAGVGRAPAETPAQHGARLAAMAPAAAAGLDGVGRMATEALWAPPNGLVLSEFEHAAALARAQIRPVLPRSRRLRARVLWGR